MPGPDCDVRNGAEPRAFEDSHFSFWVGPEIWKLLAPGRILYVTPGFGVDPDARRGDRDWTFEVGFRWFLE